MRGATVDHDGVVARQGQDGEAAGADHCIDYKSEDVGARVAELTGKRGVDAVIEMNINANAKLLPSVLRPKGSVIIYGIAGPEAAIPGPFCPSNSIKLQFFLVYELDAAERQRATDAIRGAGESGKLINTVAQPTYAAGRHCRRP